MIPGRRQWRAWSPIEKTTYLSQLATLAALLLTVLFSLLTLRESRLARQEQATYFLAEKAPNLSLDLAGLSGDHFVLTFSNEGESIATLVVLDVTASVSGGPRKSLKNDKISFGEPEPFEMKIQKSKKRRVDVCSSKVLADAIGFRPTEFRVKQVLEATQMEDGKNAYIDVQIEYLDIQGNRYRWGFGIEARK